MSQAGSSGGGSGPLPPEVATSYELDVGIAVPALNVLLVNGETDGNFNVKGLQTEIGAANQINITLTGRSQGSDQTVGAVTSNMASITLPATVQTAAQLFAYVAGLESATGDIYTATAQGAAYSDGTTASVVGSAIVNAISSAGLAAATVDFTVTGNNVRVTVTGVAAKTIDWQVVMYNTQISV